MDGFEHLLDEFGTHATEGTLRTTLVQDFVVATSLKNRYIMFLLERTDFATYTHTLGQYFDDSIVAFVDLGTEFVQAFGAMLFLTDDEQVEDIAQDVRSYLLRSVTPGCIRVAMAFGDDTVEAQVHGLLAERSHQFTLATDVRWVAEDRQIGDATTQFDRNVPLRKVAINLLVVRRETTMDGTQALQTGTVDALERTDPKFEVGVHRILHQYGHVYTLQGVCQLLYGKRVSSGTGTYPKDVDACFQRFFHVLRGSHFGSGKHTCLGLDALHPCQTFHADTFETTRFGAWFPNACTEYLDTSIGQ